MLNIPRPPVKLDPFSQGDEVAGFIEECVVQAEKQIRGVHRGAERQEAIVEAVAASVELPALYPKKFALYMVQVLYHHIARNLPDNLRQSKTEPPTPERR